MSGHHLETYLSDHLAGAVGAVQLIEDLLKHERSNGLNPVLRHILSELRAEQEVLRRILTHYGLKESGVKMLFGWFGEKFAAMKLVAGKSESPLQMMQALEMLEVGIGGKRLEWIALEETMAEDARKLGIDFAGLIQQAERQQRDLEHYRVEYAKSAFLGGKDG